MTDLAGPYPQTDPSIRERRFQEACRVAARLMRNAAVLLSPVVFGHPLAQHGLPTGWRFWERRSAAHFMGCG
ncbi:MAG: DUF1937 family protein [Planctomycetes bacterium]|nr:DUF1937 family protein [Planctomycetota bacterium]